MPFVSFVDEPLVAKTAKRLCGVLRQISASSTESDSGLSEMRYGAGPANWRNANGRRVKGDDDVIEETSRRHRRKIFSPLRVPQRGTREVQTRSKTTDERNVDVPSPDVTWTLGRTDVGADGTSTSGADQEVNSVRYLVVALCNLRAPAY